MTMHLPFTHPRRRQNVLLDLSSTGSHAAAGRAIEQALSAVIDQPHLQLVGLCCGVRTGADPALVDERVDEAVGVMEQVRRDYGLIMTELIIEEDQDLANLSAAGGPDPDDLLAAVDDALDDACARNRYPRPTITLMARPTVSADIPPRTASLVR